MIQQENPEQEATSSSEQTSIHFVLKTHQSSVVLQIHSYQYVEASATKFKSRFYLIQQYTKKRDLNLHEN